MTTGDLKTEEVYFRVMMTPPATTHRTLSNPFASHFFIADIIIPYAK